jgi:hypothetical protein
VIDTRLINLLSFLHGMKLHFIIIKLYINACVTVDMLLALYVGNQMIIHPHHHLLHVIILLILLLIIEFYKFSSCILRDTQDYVLISPTCWLSLIVLKFSLELFSSLCLFLLSLLIIRVIILLINAIIDIVPPLIIIHALIILVVVVLTL